MRVGETNRQRDRKGDKVRARKYIEIQHERGRPSDTGRQTETDRQRGNENESKEMNRGTARKRERKRDRQTDRQTERE